MENQELRLKYRPTSFDEFLGNEVMVKSLKSVIYRKEGRPHTLLFQGPSGCGKTTLARILATELGCGDHDFYEYNISDMTGVDTARLIISKVAFSPLSGKCKVYVLNECHMASKQFQNAMLDVLENPPSHVYFILCTTEPEKLLPTIRGQRASIFEVKFLGRNDIIKLVKDVCKEEKVELPDKFYTEIASCSEGSPRAALNILDKIIDIDDDEQAFNAINNATVEETEIKELLQLLVDGKSKPSHKQIATLIKGININDVEKIRLTIKKYMGSVFLNSGNERHYLIMRLFLENFYYSGREGLIDALTIARKI